jgi:hypothetical protein
LLDNLLRAGIGFPVLPVLPERIDGSLDEIRMLPPRGERSFGRGGDPERKGGQKA